MRKPSLGENLAREWDEEPHAPELWDALEVIKSDPRRGLAMLTHLAENGSALAMMHLGRAHLAGKYGLQKNSEFGEAWLGRSAATGSIEGAFDLALAFLKSANPIRGIAELSRLAELGYSPALAALALEYDKGRFVARDVAKALFYYGMAEEKGHLLASNQICFILLRKEMGPRSWLRGLIKKVRLSIPFIVARLNYPKSDRFSI